MKKIKKKEKNVASRQTGQDASKLGENIPHATFLFFIFIFSILFLYFLFKMPKIKSYLQKFREQIILINKSSYFSDISSRSVGIFLNLWELVNIGFLLHQSRNFGEYTMSESTIPFFDRRFVNSPPCG